MSSSCFSLFVTISFPVSRRCWSTHPRPLCTNAIRGRECAGSSMKSSSPTMTRVSVCVPPSRLADTLILARASGTDGWVSLSILQWTLYNKQHRWQTCSKEEDSNLTDKLQLASCSMTFALASKPLIFVCAQAKLYKCIKVSSHTYLSFNILAVCGDITSHLNIHPSTVKMVVETK